MVGKKKANVLGRALIKNRFSNTSKKKVDDNMIHVADLKDGYDWARLNLQSVTEEDSFQAFLRTAELAGTEFQAEKLNIQFVNPKSNVGLLSTVERIDVENLIKSKKDLLKIPRRPKWTKETTPEELHALENKSFLDWRKDLALLQENEGLLMTPYEKNLEFWRQLWRVIEKSDVVVQIVDARNPLLFRSEDLERYVKEVDENKQNVLLLNKADFLNEEQRIHWARYFDEQNLTIAFFTAIQEELEDIEEKDESIKGSLKGDNDEVADIDDIDDDNEDDIDDEEDYGSEVESEEENAEEKKLSLKDIKDQVKAIEKGLEGIEKELEVIETKPDEANASSSSLGATCVGLRNNPNILTRLELIEFFKSVRRNHPTANEKDTAVIGLMGYPNVGKSSTINALLQEKKVSVSATPGKTKHFQTLFLETDLMLCDCCGLVLPSFCVTKADMVLNGILPIDQVRDHTPPINQLCIYIPRHILEQTYGILIAKPLEGEDQNRPPYSEEFLLAFGYNRGFMTANGQPDQARSSRYVLKDYVNGRLLYCHAPPSVDQLKFHTYPERTTDEIILKTLPPRQQRSMKILTGKTSKEVDDAFFEQASNTARVQGRNDFMHFRGAQSMSGSKTSLEAMAKPWKHVKREKKEKLRIKYVHLDQH